MKLYDETMMTETPEAPVVPNNNTTEQANYNASTQAAPANAPAVVKPTAPVGNNYQNVYNAATTTAAPTASVNSAPATLDYTGQINDIYDKYLAAQRAQLDSSYEANMRELEAAAAKIPGLYQQRGNDLNAQYERNRAALNEQMAANGLNVGAGSQARLAQNTGYLNAYGQIQAAQADAQAAIEQQKAAREAEYQAAITQALRDNDYQRAVALTQEMKDQRNADLDRAKLLAGYGDFSGYAQLYGDDAANNMRDVWMAQNPQYAYMTGNLTADQYYKLTGQYPAGYSTPGRGYTYTPQINEEDTTTERKIPGYDGTTKPPLSRNPVTALNGVTSPETFRQILSGFDLDNLTATQKQQIGDMYQRVRSGLNPARDIMRKE